MIDFPAQVVLFPNLLQICCAKLMKIYVPVPLWYIYESLLVASMEYCVCMKYSGNLQFTKCTVAIRILFFLFKILQKEWELDENFSEYL